MKKIFKRWLSVGADEALVELNQNRPLARIKVEVVLDSIDYATFVFLLFEEIGDQR